MRWSVVWSTQAQHDLRHLDRQVATRVERAVERLAETEQGDVARLKGEVPPQWRLRVGDWRVRFHQDGENVRVLRVRNRRGYR